MILEVINMVLLMEKSNMLNEANADSYVKDYKKIVSRVEKTSSKRGEITNRRGNNVVPRKYHMTVEELDRKRSIWAERVKDVPQGIREGVSSYFFNAYRSSGAYYGCIQSLFLLGGNVWHSYVDVRNKMQEDMSTRSSNNSKKNSWEKFALKGAREGAVSTKDLMGRIIHNFRVLQRLGGIHPYGYKLKQALASVDIKRESDGLYYFRLNTTFKKLDDVKPYYDVSSYQKPRKKKRGSVKKKDIVSSAVSSD